MKQRLALTTLVVEDYAPALAFYVDTLGFALVEDTHLDEISADGQPKRWVVVSPPGQPEFGLLLARADNDEQKSRIGNQTGGRVFLFLETDDFWRDHEAYRSRGVTFVRGAPREEPYGTVAVFEDLYGNLFDLIERKS